MKRNLLIRLLLVFVLVMSLAVMTACNAGGGTDNGDNGGENGGNTDGGNEGGNTEGGNGNTEGGNGGNGGNTEGGNGGSGDKEEKLPENFYLNLFSAPDELGNVKISIEDLSLTVVNPGETMSAQQTDIIEFILELDAETGAISGGFVAEIGMLSIDGISKAYARGIIENTNVYVEYKNTDATGKVVEEGTEVIDLMEVISSMMGGTDEKIEGEYGEIEKLDAESGTAPASDVEMDEGAVEGGMNSFMTMIPVILEQLLPHANDFIEANDETIDSILGKLVNIAFTVEATEDGYTVALDLDKIKQLNADLEALTVKQVVDKYFGEGAYDAVVAAIKQVCGLKMSEIKAFLGTLGFKADELFTTIDSIAAMTGAEGFELEAMLGSAEMKDMTVSQLIGGGEDIVPMIDTYATQIAAMNIYTLLGDAMTGAPEVDEVPENGAAPASDVEVPGIKEMVDSVIDMFKGKIALEINTDETGKVTSVVIATDTLVIDTATVTLTLTFELNGTMDLTWKEDFMKKFETEAAAA